MDNTGFRKNILFDQLSLHLALYLEMGHFHQDVPHMSEFQKSCAKNMCISQIFELFYDMHATPRTVREKSLTAFLEYFLFLGCNFDCF